MNAKPPPRRPVKFPEMLPTRVRRGTTATMARLAKRRKLSRSALIRSLLDKEIERVKTTEK